MLVIAVPSISLRGFDALFVETDPLAFRDDMAFNGGEEVVTVGRRREFQQLVENQDPEVIVMCGIAHRRLGPEGSIGGEAAAALHGASRLYEAGLFLHPLGS